MSPALWRTNSSGQRSVASPTRPSSDSTSESVERRAQGQPPGPERLDLAHEAEGARRRQLAARSSSGVMS